MTSDEGAYALQASALRHGSWAYDYKAAPFDPDGRSFPVVLSHRSGQSYYTYIQHPAYPVLLSGVSALAGTTVGLHLLALLGTVGTAAAAWLLAGEVNERLLRAAFWLAALSPALVNGYLLWAHTLAAAVAGLTLVALVRTLRRGTTAWRTVATATGLAVGVLLRSEGILFAMTLAAVMAGVAWRRRDAEHESAGTAVADTRVRMVRAGVALVLVAGPAVVAALAERVWVRAIVGGAYDSLHDRAAGRPWLSGRLTAIWHDLFQGAYAGSGRILAPLALAAIVGFGVVALRRWRHDSVPALGIGVAIAIGPTLVELVRYPHESASGLFAAWPVALLGLVLVRWRRERQVVGILGMTVGLFAVAVIVTEYADGGGVEWGGRFFFAMLAPLAVLAVVGLDRALSRAPRAGRYAASGLLASLALANAVLGVGVVAQLRADQGGLAEAVARHPAPVTVTTVPALPRVAWSTHDTVSWMLTDAVGLQDVLAGLRSRGLTEVAVVTARPGPGRAASLAGFPTLEEIDEPDLAAHGLGLYVLHP